MIVVQSCGIGAKGDMKVTRSTMNLNECILKSRYSYYTSRDVYIILLRYKETQEREAYVQFQS
jgi:hypothetical protein